MYYTGKFIIQRIGIKNIYYLKYIL